jgi:hypothetical protein
MRLLDVSCTQQVVLAAPSKKAANVVKALAGVSFTV